MTTRHRRTWLAPAVLVIGLTAGITACGDSSDGQAASDRSASSADCPARFGCATTPVSFVVRNDSDTAITLTASEFINVRDADRLSLTMTVPARSTSETKPVYLGDDGLESYGGVYVRGGYEGQWTWEIRTEGSTTTARVGLIANEDFEFGLDIFEGWAQIGQPLPTFESAYDPVTLSNGGGTATWTAVGSNVDSWDENRPEPFSWTFSPAP